jgi:hypothetical protein
MGRTQLVERRAAHGERLEGLERDDGRGARLDVADERLLAEEVAGAEDGERRDLAHRRRRADRNATAADEVQRVADVTFVEHDLAACEPASRRGPHDALAVVVRQVS